MNIKISLQNAGKIALILGMLSMLMSIILIMYQCRFFKQEIEKMIQLQDDYRNHLVAVNKVLQDYNKIKERLDALESNDQKKKILKDSDALAFNGFPQGAQVFSSDDTDEEHQESFVAINRDLEYLKQSTVSYFKQRQMNLVLNRLNLDDWSEYTDQLRASHKRHVPRKRRTSRSKRVSLAERRIERIRPAEYVQEAKDLSFVWPIDRSQFWLSSRFGPRRKANGARGFHYGVDMAAVKGTPVYAAASGVVIQAYRSPGYGNTIVIAHNRKYRTRYAHLNSIHVKVGQNVHKGDFIGKVGATGHVRSKYGNASHLHFEVCAFGKQVNPLYFLS
ncbi:MAG: M23 family metallopeptidase [Candidatus Babeliales bacterium]